MVNLWSAAPIAPFAGGTGVAQSAEQTIAVDTRATHLAFAKLSVCQEAPAVAESACVIGRFAGNNFKNTPAELISNIVGNRLGTPMYGSTYDAEWYEFNLPVPSGDNISFTVEPIDANAGNIQCTLDIIWANGLNGSPLNRIFERETINTTTVGAGFTISQGSEVRDFTVAMVPGGVLTADEQQSGRISANSSGFGLQNTLTLSYLVHPIEVTAGGSLTHPNRAKGLRIPIVHSTAAVTSSLAETSAPTNAAAWLMGIGYIPRVVNPA
jgi:hypothetical protein